jgi:hypothetical protein
MDIERSEPSWHDHPSATTGNARVFCPGDVRVADVGFVTNLIAACRREDGPMRWSKRMTQQCRLMPGADAQGFGSIGRGESAYPLS